NPGPVIINTSAALTSIQALSADDCAAATFWSSWSSLSLTVLEIPSEAVAEPEAEAEGCCARSDTAASISVISRQQPATPKRFIEFSDATSLPPSSLVPCSYCSGDQPRCTGIIRGTASHHLLKFCCPGFIFRIAVRLTAFLLFRLQSGRRRVWDAGSGSRRRPEV